jgi:hypothetical protein
MKPSYENALILSMLSLVLAYQVEPVYAKVVWGTGWFVWLYVSLRRATEGR